MQQIAQLTRRDNTVAMPHCVVYSKFLKTGGPRWLGLGDKSLRKVLGSFAKPDTQFRRDTCGIEPATLQSSVTGTEAHLRKFASDWVGCRRSSTIHHSGCLWEDLLHLHLAKNSLKNSLGQENLEIFLLMATEKKILIEMDNGRHWLDGRVQCTSDETWLLIFFFFNINIVSFSNSQWLKYHILKFLFVCAPPQHFCESPLGSEKMSISVPF